MEEMFQAFRDLAEFRLVYIQEAHAADSDWSVDYAEQLGITIHDDYEERCTTASMLLKDKKLTVPFVIDTMHDAVDKAYHARPDRVFLIRPDGRLAVAAKRGPRGFAPALEATREWLEQYRAQGEPPQLPEDAAGPGEPVHVTTEEATSSADDS